jgi:hypothetical protein
MNLYAILIAAAVAFGASWKVQDWRYGEKIQEARAEQSESALKVFQAAQKTYEADLAKKDKAIHDATLRAQTNQALARALDGDVDRMRDELSAERSRLPAASCEAVRKHAETLSSTLGSCIGEYSDMAREAQGYLSDVMLLEAAP